MSDVVHQPVFDHLNALREALRAESSPEAERVLYQCERLEQAVRYSHAEAIRFAAYTINHVAASADSRLSEATRQRVADLRTALAAAGHTF